MGAKRALKTPLFPEKRFIRGTPNSSPEAGPEAAVNPVRSESRKEGAKEGNSLKSKVRRLRGKDI